MDYVFQGKQLNHYRLPTATDLSLWDQEALQKIAREKIVELKARLAEVTTHHNQRLELLEIIKDKYFQFHRKFWEYQYQLEKYYIEKWLLYWKGFISKPKVIKNRLTPDDIAKAGQYPLEQLYVGQLRQISGKFVGLCPFHQEKTPSFTIFNNNRYFCFGCNANGNAITFLMNTKNLDFPKAVKELI